MLLAKQGKIDQPEDQERYENTLKAFSGNEELQNSLKNEVKKYQPDVGYKKDDGTIDKQALKDDLRSGKTSLDNLRAESFSDTDFIGTVQEAYGSKFGVKMKGIIDRGGSDYKNNIGKGLKKSFAGENITEADGKLNKKRKAYAEISGDVDGAFGDAAGKITAGSDNEKAAEKYLSKADAGELSKIDTSKMSDDLKRIIGKTIQVGQLKNLDRAGEREHVQEFIKAAEAGGNTELTDRIKNDLVLGEHVSGRSTRTQSNIDRQQTQIDRRNQRIQDLEQKRAEIQNQRNREMDIALRNQLKQQIDEFTDKIEDQISEREKFEDEKSRLENE